MARDGKSSGSGDRSPRVAAGPRSPGRGRAEPLDDSGRLATSRQTYHRIRWDPRLDARQFTIGYEDRSHGEQELAFLEFVPDGDIPWHRVWWFRRGDEVVWDRRRRIDRLGRVGDGSVADARGAAPSGEALPLPDAAAGQRLELVPQRFDADRGRWQAAWEDRGAAGPEGRDPRRLTVVTYNVLADLHAPDKIYSADRTPAIAEILGDEVADVLALQEVTPELARALLATPWARECFASDSPRGDTVTPTGELLLSRWPMRRLARLAFSTRKTALVAELEHPAGPVVVAVVHLPSSRAANAVEARAAQLWHVLEVLTELAATSAASARATQLVLGDTNAAEFELDELMTAYGFDDAWRSLRPGEAGATYDPSRNALAALTTLSGQPGRYDRVLWRGAARPRAIALRGQAPIAPGRFASDHFAVACELGWPSAAEVAATAAPVTGVAGPAPGVSAGAPMPSTSASTGAPISTSISTSTSTSTSASRNTSATTSLSTSAAPLADPVMAADVAPHARPDALRDARPSHRSALVLVPPTALWPPLQELRRRYDRTVDRFPPHLSLLYGFVDEALFPAAAAALGPVAAQLVPFELELSHLGTFAHRASRTLWLAPRTAPPHALLALQARLQEALPGCDEQSTRSPGGYTPHLTVGQLAAPRDDDERRAADELLAGLRRRWRPLRFTVTDLVLLSRRGDEPFAERARLALGSGAITWARGEPRASARGSAAEHPAKVKAPRPSFATPRGEVTRQVAAACAAVLGLPTDAPIVHALGSERLGTAEPGSDLDLLCVGAAAAPRAELLARIAGELARRWPAATLRLAPGATVPILEAQLGEVSVDLAYVALPPEALAADRLTAAPVADLPVYWLAAHDAELDAASRLALLGVADADELLRRAGARGQLDELRALCRAVGQWAKARGIWGNAIGYLGGISWAVLAQWTLEQDPPAAGAIVHLARLTERLARWDPRQAIALPGLRHDWHSGDTLAVLAPVAPVRNTARNVTRGTWQILRDEAARATEILRGRPHAEHLPDELLAPYRPPPEAIGALQLELDVRPQDRAACAGWLLGRIRALLLDLERHCLPRPEPFSATASAARVVLVPRRPAAAPELPRLALEAAAELAAQLARWDQVPAGARLRYRFEPAVR